MNKHILVLLLALLVSSGAFAQSINSFHTNSNGDLETGLIAKNIESKEQVNLAIDAIKSIEYVKDVNFFYPESFKFTITMEKAIDAKILIDKLRQINIELTNESINFDTK